MNKSLRVLLISLLTLLTSPLLYSATTESTQTPLPVVSPQDFISRVNTQNKQVQAALDNAVNQLARSQSTQSTNAMTPPPSAPTLIAPTETPAPATPAPATPPSTTTDPGFNMYAP